MGDNIDFSTPLYRVYVEDHIVVIVPGNDATDEASWVDSLGGSSLGDNHAWTSRCKPVGEATQAKWMMKLGENLVKDLLVAELAKRGISWPSNDIVQGRLQSLPKGYYIVTVARVDDNSADQDHYLCCPDGEIRFRSPAEFSPHLAWILEGQPLGRSGQAACECIVCNPGGPAQKDISKERYGDIRQYFAREQPKKTSRKRRSTGTSTSSSRPSGRRTNALRVFKPVKFTAKDYRKWDTNTDSGDKGAPS